jgi:hypothetical protein
MIRVDWLSATRPFPNWAIAVAAFNSVALIAAHLGVPV